MPIPVTADHYHSMVVLHPTTGDAPNERKTWNLYWRNDDVGAPPPDVVPHIKARLEAFLSADDGAGDGIGTLIPGRYARPFELRVYDLGEAAPRTPYTSTVACPNGMDAITLPPDVAIRLTTRAITAPKTAPSETNPKVRARRRTGGFYFGPLNTGVLNQPAPLSTASDGQVKTAVLNGLAAAMAGLASVSLVHPVRLVLLQPTTGFSWPVTDGFVDGELDTQRRRGKEEPTRVSWVST